MSRILSEMERIHFSLESLEKELAKWKDATGYKIFVKSLTGKPLPETLKESCPQVQFGQLKLDGPRFGLLNQRIAGAVRLKEFGVSYYIMLAPMDSSRPKKRVCEFSGYIPNTKESEILSFNSSLERVFGSQFTKKELSLARCTLEYDSAGDSFWFNDEFYDHAYDLERRMSQAWVMLKVSTFDDPGCPAVACFADPDIEL